jgi:hypothetical protein
MGPVIGSIASDETCGSVPCDVARNSISASGARPWQVCVLVARRGCDSFLGRVATARLNIVPVSAVATHARALGRAPNGFRGGRSGRRVVRTDPIGAIDGLAVGTERCTREPRVNALLEDQ